MFFVVGPLLILDTLEWEVNLKTQQLVYLHKTTEKYTLL